MIAPDLLAALYESIWISSQKTMSKAVRPVKSRNRKKHAATTLRRSTAKKRTPRLYATIS
jgi:hypothetical protein